MEKIKQNGSLYGVPDSGEQCSVELAEQRAAGWINTAKKLFNREEISDHYKEFISHAMDNIDELAAGNGADGVWKVPRLEDTKSPDIKEVVREGSITVGKPKLTLDSNLKFDEKAKLKKAVDDHGQKLETKITNRYHDAFNSSIMMSEEDTRDRNQILRKIKLFKVKKKDLVNFKRMERERIISDREPEETSPTLRKRLTVKKPTAHTSADLSKTNNSAAEEMVKDFKMSNTMKLQEGKDAEYRERKQQFETFMRDIL